VSRRALDCLSDGCFRSGADAEAARWAEELTVLEPYREWGYRRLMQAHVAAGNRAEALRVYERCRRLLAEELGAYPSPETESIYRALLDTPSLEPRPLDTATAPAALVDGRPEIRGRAALRRLGMHRPAALLVATGAALLVAAAVAVVELTGAGAGGLTSAAANSAAVIDTTSNRLVSDVSLGTGPTKIAVGEGAVWATNEQERSVLTRMARPIRHRLVQRPCRGHDDNPHVPAGACATFAC
jgi:hypothetical protein